MTSEIIVAAVSCAGTLLGSLFGVMAAAKLTDYRLAQLEKKVEKHNSLVERMTAAELHIDILARQFDTNEK